MIDITDIQADIERSKHGIRALQSETVHTVTIKPSGKIEVVDKAKLEDLNAEIDRLNGLVGQNEPTLARLQECLQKVSMPSVAELKHSRDRARQNIEDYKRACNRICADWLRTSPTYTLQTIESHPRVAPQLKDYAARTQDAEAKLKLFTSALEEAEAILAGFQPSGLPEIKSRSVGVARFDMPAKAPF